MIEERIAMINKAELGIEDHGIFGFNLDFKYSASLYQGTGWWGIQKSDILRVILEIAAADRWDKLQGKHIIVLIEDLSVIGIKALPTTSDQTIFFKEYFAKEKLTVPETFKVSVSA